MRTFDPAHDVPIEFHAHWLVGPDRALTPGMRAVLGERDDAPSGARARAGALINLGLNALAGHQGNIFGFVIRKDRACPQPWIVGDS